METKQFQYNAAINTDLIKQYLDSFKEELIPNFPQQKDSNIKYILLSISITRNDLKADLCKNIKFNLTSKGNQILSNINKNAKILIKHFGNENFDEILFQYKILTYSEFISINNQQKQLKSLITNIKPIVKDKKDKPK